MASVILLLIAITFLTYVVYKYMTSRPDNFPPGPPKIPIFGSYLFLLMVNPKWLHKAAVVFSKLYNSKLIGFYIGPYLTVVANSHDIAKEILNRREFDGRPDIFLGRLRNPDFNRRGIFFVDGPQWKQQRRFVLRYLRDFGFGRRFQELEIVMNEEIQDMIDLIKNGPKYPHEEELFQKGRALCPNFMSICTTNSFFYIMCNERVPRPNQDSIIELAKQGMILQRNGDDYGRLLSILPWIRYFFPNISGYKPLRSSSMYMHKFFEEVIEKSMKTYDKSHERHFLDLYITEMKKAEHDEEHNSYFILDQFILSMIDFSFPAITAISVQTSLLLQWFLLRPDVLKKVQEEIDTVVGNGRLPALDDRINLPYTEATVREGLRIETLVPSDIPHCALVETDLRGYTIPKDCIVIPSLYAMHLDESVWTNPTEFKPERYLDENGKLSLKKDISLPFGAGKRLCAGETFARNMLFLITAALCQNFDVVLAPGQSPPDLSKNLNGIVISPPDFWVNLKTREIPA